MAFAHLHVHSEYSLLDGAARIPDLVRNAKESGQTSLAITDHGVMYGVVDFYSACLDAGIHPVIGCEVYVAPGDMTNKTSTDREYSHLILLCETQQGYRNLTRLVSESFLRGYYYKPRVDLQTMQRYHEGLICLSACISGELPRLLLQGQYEQAKQLALTYLNVFGKDHYYIELQDHGLREEKQILPLLKQISRETGIPMVVTNDVHYIRREDALSQEILMCIQTGKTIDDPSHMRMGTDQLYFKTEEEMMSLFSDVPDAVSRTEEIAQRCQVTFTFGKYHLPDFPVPNGEDHFAYLSRLCQEGMQKKYHGTAGKEHTDRLQYELSVIHSMGYVDYFLIVWDFIKYAKDHGIPVGPGRGSGAGSIVAYCLDITDVEPLSAHLIFERFLNPERVSMPDIDVDFCYERRQEVIDYVTRKYGEDRVSQIITFGTMAARAVIRDVGRALGMSYAQCDSIAKMIPNDLKMTLNKAITINGELKRLVEEDEQVGRLWQLACALEGMPRHASTHAAGVVITGQPVYDFVPLQKNDDVVTTQFPMTTIEHLGLLKMDFLGLRTLTIINDAMNMIRESTGTPIKLSDFPMDDPATYKMLGEGDTDGVFQLESAGMRRVLVDLKPSNIEDVTAIISLYRPGPMESIPQYVEGKRHPENVTYLHPILENILKETYGCMVYQEQVMQIVRDMGGYSLGRSDLVRRAMSKKKASEMEKERTVFIEGLTDEQGNVVVPGTRRKGIPDEVALEVFSRMESFAQYAFNKSHAAAYAVVAFQTAYLKCHYLPEFMAASMNAALSNTTKVASLIQYCRKHSIPILPPDVNRSETHFTVENGGIRFGLGAVRNVGEQAVETIKQGRKASPYKDFYDFCEHIDLSLVNKRCVESLIKAGAFDGLGASRAQLLSVYESVLDGAGNRKKDALSGQISLFDDVSLQPEHPPLPQVEDLPSNVRLALEKEMTGIYITGHPLDEYRQILDHFPVHTGLFIEEEEGQKEEMIARYDHMQVKMGGLLTSVRTRTTRNNQIMGFIVLEDLYGTIEGLVFPRTLEKCRSQLLEDSAVVVEGRLSVREDEDVKLIVEAVSPLRREISHKLYLRIPTRSQMENICEILQRYPGDTPVAFYVETEKKTLLAPRQYNIDARSEILSALGRQMSQQDIRLV